jgi:CBS domain-containing protein
MKAGECMTTPVLAATPRASVRDVATQLVARGISGMPVAERGGKIIGVITEADVLEAISTGKSLEKLTVEEIMCDEPVTVDVEAPLQDVAKLLNEEGIVRVPVTDKERLVGIISRVDVIKAALEPEFLTFGDSRT